MSLVAMPRTATLLTTSCGASATSAYQKNFSWVVSRASAAEKLSRSHWSLSPAASTSRTAARLLKHQLSAPAANPLHITAPHGTTSRVTMATSSSVCGAHDSAAGPFAVAANYTGCVWGDVLAHPTVFVVGAAFAATAAGGLGLLPQWGHRGRGRINVGRIAMVSVVTLCMYVCTVVVCSCLCRLNSQVRREHDAWMVLYHKHRTYGIMLDMFLLISFSTRCDKV